jgi:hypothetical protein
LDIGLENSINKLNWIKMEIVFSCLEVKNSDNEFNDDFDDDADDDEFSSFFLKRRILKYQST